MAKNKTLDNWAMGLTAAGGINWGLVGAFKFNLVQWIAELVNWAFLADVVYVVVGVSTLYLVYKAFNK